MMARKAWAWTAALAMLVIASTAWGTMGGVSRESAWTVEIYANGKEVKRGAGTWAVSVPKDLAPVLDAVGVKVGTSVSLGEWDREAKLQKVEKGWFSLQLTFKMPLGMGAPKPVECFRMIPWSDFGAKVREELAALPKGKADEYGTGLAAALGRVKTVFGGASLAEAFPKTDYAKEFARVKKFTDAVVRTGTMLGWVAGALAKARYEEVFGEAWPQTAVGVFWTAGDEALLIKDVRKADGRTRVEVFSGELPVQIEGRRGTMGVFPRGERLKIRYGLPENSISDRILEWAFGEEDDATWFVLAAGAGGEITDIATRAENRGAIPVKASIDIGGKNVGTAIPPGGTVVLRLALPKGVLPQFHAEADGKTMEHPEDYAVRVRQDEKAGVVAVESSRKAYPEMVLNNPEIMPVDVEVMSERTKGRFERETTVRLKAGEMGFGIPVPPHKALELRCRFKSDFHKPGRVAVKPLSYGDRENLVLRAEKKGDPEVTILNAGKVAVAVSGQSGPKAHVGIAAGQQATVTVVPGKRVTLEFTAANKDYAAEPLVLSAMSPGESRRVSTKAVLKGEPKVVLDNERGMMDVEATLTSSTGMALGRPVRIKRGKKSEPISLPLRPGLEFRLKYTRDSFSAKGALKVPEVPRGETKTLVVPGPKLVGSEATSPGTRPGRNSLSL